MDDHIHDSQINRNDLKLIRSLGSGCFAKVDLMMNSKGKTMALKTAKEDVNTDVDIFRLVNKERIVMETSGQASIFVVKYYGCLPSEFSMYPCILVMEACLGGDLWNVMKEQGGRLENDAALFYICCVIEGLTYLESKNILYRDLKPENILVDGRTGYVKIADFGFSSILQPGETTSTPVGTAEYLAPEILKKVGYNKKATHWALGILIYELLTGTPPFRGDQLYSKIGKGFRHHVFPGVMSSSAVEMVQMLCRMIPDKRPGLDSIRRYSWFIGFDWESLRTGVLEAPLLPTFKEYGSQEVEVRLSAQLSLEEESEQRGF